MKHPVPKQKKSRLRSAQRYGAFTRAVRTRLTEMVQLSVCPQCGEKKMQHRVCPTCGTYKGKEVIKVGKSTKKIKTVKA